MTLILYSLHRLDVSKMFLICFIQIFNYLISGLILVIAKVSDGSTITIVVFMREDTEKLCTHHTQINNVKLITHH